MDELKRRCDEVKDFYDDLNVKLVRPAGDMPVSYTHLDVYKRQISELGYGMLFGSDVKKQFFQKRIKGRGYCDVGTSVISEFYTPLVPKGHDFLQTIGFLAQARQDGTATCEAKGDGTD